MIPGETMTEEEQKQLLARERRELAWSEQQQAHVREQQMQTRLKPIPIRKQWFVPVTNLIYRKTP